MANESLYERIGGASVLHKLVNTFYDIVENDPEGEILNLVHLRGHGIAHSRIEQFNFLSGFLGCPQLYIEKHGHSDVREIHRHVQVGPAERDAWLSCMSRAIKIAGIEPDTSTVLIRHFRAVADSLEVENRANEDRRRKAIS
ncbi:MAG: group II truncated hemoglobin [Methylovirgula sp.]